MKSYHPDVIDEYMKHEINDGLEEFYNDEDYYEE
jgi:hypothetical protein